MFVTYAIIKATPGCPLGLRSGLKYLHSGYLSVTGPGIGSVLRGNSPCPSKVFVFNAYSRQLIGENWQSYLSLSRDE